MSFEHARFMPLWIKNYDLAKLYSKITFKLGEAVKRSDKDINGLIADMSARGGG